MIKVKFIFFVYLYMFFLSCNNLTRIPENHVAKDENIISILPNKEDLKPIDLTPYLDSVKYVKLELTDESIIGSIDKLIIYEERIYILDTKTRSLFIFDMEGRYLHKIARVGQGPGEYIHLDFFDIDRENKQIVLTDLMAYWVMRYDMDGKFLFRQKIPIWCEGVSLLPNKGIVLYANFRNNSDKLTQEYNIIYLDSAMNYKKAYFPYSSKNFNIKISTSVAGHFYHFKDHLNFSFPNGSAVYQLNDDSLISKYKFDLGKDFLSIENIENTKQYMNYYENNKHNGIWGYVMENDELLFFSLKIKEHPYILTVYYSKKTGKSLLSFLFMIEKGFSIIHPQYGYDSWIVSEEIQASSLREWKNSFPKESIASTGRYTKSRLKLAEELTDDDNPVLMFFKLKEF